MSCQPVEQLSTTEIKNELSTLYGIRNFADCIEPRDLQQKLHEQRASGLVTYGLSYGQLFMLGNKTNPTGVVTLSHGLGDSAMGWYSVGEQLSKRFPYLLFIVPSSAQIPVSVNGGMVMNAWYDIKVMISQNLRSGAQDGASLMRSAEYIRSLASTSCNKYHINPSRVIFAGFSQGAAVALAAGLTSQVAPAGIACMSGYLAAASTLIPRIVNKHVPITFFHGKQDPMVPFAATHESMKSLQEEAHYQGQMELRAYNMEHSTTPQEIDDLAAFIRRLLPEGNSA